MALQGKTMTSATVLTPAGMWFLGGQGQAYPDAPGQPAQPRTGFRPPPGRAACGHGSPRGSRLSRSAPTPVDGVPLESVRVVSGAMDITLGLETSGRIHSATYRDRNAEGEFGTITVRYADYRAVEGLQLPFTTRVTFNGQPDPSLSATIESDLTQFAARRVALRTQDAGRPMTTVAVWALALLIGFAPAADRVAWPQWGGPARNFVRTEVDARELATTWPAEGPRRLWQRPLGEGYSAIVTDGRTLYTLFREGTADVAIALDAATGKTVWETRYDAPFVETCSERLGPVPVPRRSLPAIA